MKRLGVLVPAAMAAVTGSDAVPAIEDAHVQFLRRAAATARTQNARDMAARLERIADRIASAVAAGQLLPVRDAD